MTILTTKRMRREPFAAQHLDGLSAMNQKPEAMRFIGGAPETREQTAAAIARVQRAWSVLGTSWWAFIDADGDQVLGAGCIQHGRAESESPSDLEALRTNPLEIGWRLHPEYWGRGLATEAAMRMASFAFDDLRAPELIAVRHPDNISSARVMDRLQMRYRGMERWYGVMLATHAIGHDEWRTAARVDAEY